MNKIYNPKQENWASLLERPTKTVDDIEATVKEIFTAVQNKGDKAVQQYTTQFDGIALDTILVSDDEVQNAIASVSDELSVLASEVDVSVSWEVASPPIISSFNSSFVVFSSAMLVTFFLL